MKKIFTFALAAMAAMTMSANTAVVTIYEGKIDAPDWGTSVTTASKAALGLVESGVIAVGSEIRLIGTKTAEDYCAIACINSNWQSLADGTVEVKDGEVVIEPRTDFSFNKELNETDTASFIVEEAGLAVFNGLELNGHGWTITKIEAVVYRVSEKEELKDLEESITLWMAEEGWEDEDEPSNMIDNWGANAVDFVSDFYVGRFAELYTRVAPMYVKLNNAGEGKHFRISGYWDDSDPDKTWAVCALPKDGYNHLINMDEDGVVRVELTEDFIKNVTTSENKGFALWGTGYFFVEAIGTTKESVMNPVRPIEPEGLFNVELQNNGIRYNMLGQQVSEDYKGIVILNGQKMLQ